MPFDQIIISKPDIYFPAPELDAQVVVQTFVRMEQKIAIKLVKIYPNEILSITRKPPPMIKTGSAENMQSSHRRRRKKSGWFQWFVILTNFACAVLAIPCYLKFNDKLQRYVLTSSRWQMVRRWF